jgi:transposase
LQSHYLHNGSATLIGVGRGGRRQALLSEEQEAQLLSKFASLAGQGGVVEASALRRAYEEKVDAKVAKSTVYRLLARQGWRKLVPRPYHPDASWKQQEAFKKLRRRVRTEARRQARRGLRLRLWFEDEARFGRMTDPRRAWAPPGVRSLVPRRIEREYGYAYAAVAPHEGALVSLVLPEVNAELMSLFLAEVARRYPKDFILMVLDGAGWHKARELIVPAQRRLEWLPARSPELNPVEHVWEELREKWLGNRLFEEQAAVDRQVAAGLASLEKDPQARGFLSRLPMDSTNAPQPQTFLIV